MGTAVSVSYKKNKTNRLYKCTYCSLNLKHLNLVSFVSKDQSRLNLYVNSRIVRRRLGLCPQHVV